MRRYYNLTQCAGMAGPGDCYIYLRSTDVEQMNWGRLLWSIPDDLLYHLSLGEKVEVYDRSTKPRGKIERIAVPVIYDVLNNILAGFEPVHANLVDHYRAARSGAEIDNQLRRRFVFWRGRIQAPARISAFTERVEREGNPCKSEPNMGQ